jgi:hypothetical protein
MKRLEKQLKALQDHLTNLSARADKGARPHAPAAHELAYTLSWVAPPSVRVVPYYPINSLIISGHPAGSRR